VALRPARASSWLASSCRAVDVRAYPILIGRCARGSGTAASSGPGFHARPGSRSAGTGTSATTGQLLRDFIRAAGTGNVRFGDLVEQAFWRPDGPDELVTLPRYGLHLQCPFRLAGPDGPIAASHDIYRSWQRPRYDPEFDQRRGTFGDTWYDARGRTWDEQPASSLPVVTEIAADRFGGLMLTMTGATPWRCSPPPPSPESTGATWSTASASTS
jgi:hypothetical protein